MAIRSVQHLPEHRYYYLYDFKGRKICELRAANIQAALSQATEYLTTLFEEGNKFRSDWVMDSLTGTFFAAVEWRDYFLNRTHVVHYHLVAAN